jgi:hypothetical protein
VTTPTTDERDVQSLAKRRQRRDEVALWVEGWGVFFLIVGTVAGIAAIVGGLVARQAWITAAGIATLLVSYLGRAVCDWAGQMLHTLGRIEDGLERRLARIVERLDDQQ